MFTSWIDERISNLTLLFSIPDDSLPDRGVIFLFPPQTFVSVTLGSLFMEFH